jgi:ornithine decarboxylase
MAPSAITTDETYTTNIFTDINIVSDDGSGKNNNYGALTSKDIIHDAMMKKIVQIDVDTCQPGEEDAFYVADLGEVYRQHLRWKLNLGSIKPFYGMPTQQLDLDLG